jgi:hypothetical protein
MLKSVMAAACLCATMVRVHASDLSGQQIADLVAGATVEIETPVGARLQARYARDGKLAGEAPGLAWYLGRATDDGRWWVASDRLCHRWSHWLSSEQHCMRLAREGRGVRWRSDDGNTGTAMITVPAAHTIQAAGMMPLALPRRVGEVAPKVAPAPVAVSEKQLTEPPAGSDGPAQEVAKDDAADAAAALPAPRRAVDPAPAVAAAEKAPAPQPQMEPKRPSQPTFKVANVRSDDVLNVRSGPSADFDKVGELAPGSRGIAVVSTCQLSWCPVQHQATRGWVNSAYLAPEESLTGSPLAPAGPLRDAPDAPRDCLAAAARTLLDRIEQRFGPVEVVSTCRPGAAIPGTWRASRHASGNAVDFKAGPRKAAIVEWLIANHRNGGTMTYLGMDHIHVDIGPHFVSIANGPHWSSWREGRGDASGP